MNTGALVCSPGCWGTRCHEVAGHEGADPRPARSLINPEVDMTFLTADWRRQINE